MDVYDIPNATQLKAKYIYSARKLTHIKLTSYGDALEFLTSTFTILDSWHSDPTKDSLYWLDVKPANLGYSIIDGKKHFVCSDVDPMSIICVPTKDKGYFQNIQIILLLAHIFLYTNELDFSIRVTICKQFLETYKITKNIFEKIYNQSYDDYKGLCKSHKAFLLKHKLKYSAHLVNTSHFIRPEVYIHFRLLCISD
jgi:hypothetical protein